MAEIKIRRVDFYPTDWLEGTISLTHLERSIYITICAAIYAQGGPVETSHVRKLCTGRGFARGLAGLVAKGKVSREVTLLCNERCMKEVTKATLRVHEGRTNGGTGGRHIKDLTKPSGSKLRARSAARATPPYLKEKNPSSSSLPSAARASSPDGGATHAHDAETGNWKPLDTVLGAPPPPSPKTQQDRAAEHWQFLFERGRAGEAEAYAATIGPDNLPPAEIFAAVEARMHTEDGP
jgi:hypothetical protein